MYFVSLTERSLICERVASGLSRARKNGQQLGRPKKIFDRDRVIALSKEGKSARSIATMLGVGKDTIYAVLRA